MIRHNSGLLIRRGELAHQDATVIVDVLHNDAYQLRRLEKPGPGTIVVDVGAHIGAFAHAWLRRDPAAEIVCVEANPDNLACLRANVPFATVQPVACTYEREFQFVNSICPGGAATGGSFLSPPGAAVGAGYTVDERVIPAATLEEIVGERSVHLLKLDCEGSEYSILPQTTVLRRTRYVVGEYHGSQARWDELRARVFVGWNYTPLKSGTNGLFLYENQAYRPPGGETSKARLRREREGWFEQYIRLDRPGLDIGAGHDPLNSLFRQWDTRDGDCTVLAGVPDESLWTVYASHVLEHLHDPVQALREWWRVLHPGGWLILSVPHCELYEGKLDLPSRWNPDHKTFLWPEAVPAGMPEHHRSLVEVVRAATGAEPQWRVCDEGHSYPDKRVHPLGEFSIEAYVQKCP